MHILYSSFVDVELKTVLNLCINGKYELPQYVNAP